MFTDVETNTHSIVIECDADVGAIIKVINPFAVVSARVSSITCREQGGKMLVVLDVQGLADAHADTLCLRLGAMPCVAAAAIVGRGTPR